MKKYEIILWDVDQTLLDFNESENYAIRKAFEQFNLSIRDEIVTLYSRINDSYWKRFEKGEVSKEEVQLGRFRTLFKEIDIQNISPEEFAPVYQRLLGSVYFYRDDSYELCKHLKEVCRQFVVTNGVTWTQRNKLKLSGLDLLMEDIFISEEMGTHKPMKEFFDKCFERIKGFERDRTIIVGDSLTSDMLGGNRAGIACCWYNPEGRKREGQLQIDYEIRNLWEIEGIIDG